MGKAKPPELSRRLRGIVIAFAWGWLGCSVGLAMLFAALAQHEVPWMLHCLVVKWSGTQEAIPLAYAWSLRLGILLAMGWLASLVLGMACYHKWRVLVGSKK